MSDSVYSIVSDRFKSKRLLWVYDSSSGKWNLEIIIHRVGELIFSHFVLELRLVLWVRRILGGC